MRSEKKKLASFLLAEKNELNTYAQFLFNRNEKVMKDFSIQPRPDPTLSHANGHEERNTEECIRGIPSTSQFETELLNFCLL